MTYTVARCSISQCSLFLPNIQMFDIPMYPLPAGYQTSISFTNTTPIDLGDTHKQYRLYMWRIVSKNASTARDHYLPPEKNDDIISVFGRLFTVYTTHLVIDFAMLNRWDWNQVWLIQVWTSRFNKGTPTFNSVACPDQIMCHIDFDEARISMVSVV